MEQITLQVRDKKKATALLKFLKTLDYVENVTRSVPQAGKEITKEMEAEFFGLAGLWAGRGITQDQLRKQAWPERK